jgi:hypothetical protein
MKIVSIDCGSKNMAVCVIETDVGGSITPESIVRLERIALHGGTISELVRSLKCELDARASHLSDVNVFVIEQQPASNIRMKVISHCIEMYAHQAHPSAVVSFSSTKAALDRVTLGLGGTVEKKLSYPARKKKSVQLATQLLTASPMAAVFGAQRKKDDCADALIHGVSWVLLMGGMLTGRHD